MRHSKCDTGQWSESIEGATNVHACALGEETRRRLAADRWMVLEERGRLNKRCCCSSSSTQLSLQLHSPERFRSAQSLKWRLRLSIILLREIAFPTSSKNRHIPKTHRIGETKSVEASGAQRQTILLIRLVSLNTQAEKQMSRQGTLCWRAHCGLRLGSMPTWARNAWRAWGFDHANPVQHQSFVCQSTKCSAHLNKCVLEGTGRQRHAPRYEK